MRPCGDSGTQSVVRSGCKLEEISVWMVDPVRPLTPHMEKPSSLLKGSFTHKELLMMRENPEVPFLIALPSLVGFAGEAQGRGPLPTRPRHALEFAHAGVSRVVSTGSSRCLAACVTFVPMRVFCFACPVTQALDLARPRFCPCGILGSGVRTSQHHDRVHSGRQKTVLPNTPRKDLTAAL